MVMKFVHEEVGNHSSKDQDQQKKHAVCISEFLIMCCYGMHDDRASRLMIYIPGQELHGTRQAKNTGTDHSCHIVESRIPPFSIPAPCHR